MGKGLRLKNRIAYLLVFILLGTMVLSGCGRETVPADTSATVAFDGPVSMETAPVLTYEVPLMQPGILVDRIGYEAAGTKLILVHGDRLPGAFDVVDANSKEVVFTGKLEEPAYDETTGEYNSYGDFSAFATEGMYYVECDMIGQSHSFVIENTLYDNLMSETLAELSVSRKELENGDIGSVCECVSTLLLSYELFGNVYDRGTPEGAQPQLISLIKEYIIWLLATQDSQTGAVLSGDTVDKEQTAWLSAVLAKFSYTYQKFDSTYATVCLQAADRAWDYLQKAEDVPQEAMFYAAAELYRATGQHAYHKEVKNLGTGVTLDAYNKAQVFGALTYAFTKRNVDVDICAGMMKVLFAVAEDVAVRANDNFYMTGSGLKQGEDILLWEMILVSAIDYVITNHEYATMIEDHLHYLAGSNEDAICHIRWSEKYADDKEAGRTDVERLAGYVMILSEILSHRQEETK